MGTSKNQASVQESYGSIMVQELKDQPSMLALPISSESYYDPSTKNKQSGDSIINTGQRGKTTTTTWKHYQISSLVITVVAVILALYSVAFTWVVMTTSSSLFVKNINKNKHATREYIDSMLLSLETMMMPTVLHDHPLELQQQIVPTSSTADIIITDNSIKGDDSSSTILVYLNQSKAYDMLFASSPKYCQHYFAYETGLDVQKNQAYCGVATVTAVLNSLRVANNATTTTTATTATTTTTTTTTINGIDLPTDDIYFPYPYATQTNIFNNCTQNTVISNNNKYNNAVDGILTLPYGLSLQQVSGLLECHLSKQQWNIMVYQTTPPQVGVKEEEELVARQQMRSIMIDALGKPRSRLLINYHRVWLGQGLVGGGHFSPIGAYNEESDSFLIVDVSKYKYPPVWATFAQIYHAMLTIDSCGVWNWPNAQANLVPDSLKQGHLPSNKEEYEAGQKLLGCTPSYRGFVVIDEIPV